MDDFRFNKKTDDLFKAVLNLENVKEAEAFFRDLCTIDEIKDMSERWEVAKLIYEEVPHNKIAEKTGISITKISRIAVWVFHGEGGYKSVLEKLDKKSE
jgi:TrpR-related protein YerC/YecD